MLLQVTTVPVISLYEQRLRNCIVALRESPRPDAFSMKRFGWGIFDSNPQGYLCGTPACVLGHYAARTDLQDAFVLDAQGYRGSGRYGYTPATWGAECAHFGLTIGECSELFGVVGCGGARTTQEAIAYLEAFIAHRYPADQE